MISRTRSTAGATLIALLLAASCPALAGAAIFGKKKVAQDTMPGRKLTPAQNALIDKAIVREKELGSITNLYVTPVTRIEFLVGKQLPYIAIAMVNFSLLFLMALFVFKVPLKGSLPTLLLGVSIYVTTTTAYGMLISAFTKPQIAALFGTAILTVLPATQFSGMMTPVSSLSGTARIMGQAFPMSYFVPISVGTFTKGLGFHDLGTDLAKLTIFVPVLLLLSLLLLRKQER